VKVLIVDEADEMLSRGFRDQLFDIVQSLPPDFQIVGDAEICDDCPTTLVDSPFGGMVMSTQICLFSATMPDEMLEITSKVCHNPFKAVLPKEEITLAGIKQYYVDCGEDRDKFPTFSTKIWPAHKPSSTAIAVAPLNGSLPSSTRATSLSERFMRVLATRSALKS